MDMICLMSKVLSLGSTHQSQWELWVLSVSVTQTFGTES